MHMNIFNVPMYVSSGHSDVVRSVAFSRDGKTIVSGSEDKSVKIWDMETGDVAEETQNLAVNVDETAMLRAEIAKNLRESLKREHELQKKEQELQKQSMEMESLRMEMEKQRIEMEKQRVEIANLKQASPESCSPTAVNVSIDVSIDRNELRKKMQEIILKAWTSAFQDK